VRNRAKIEATIANCAGLTADAEVDLSELLWSFAPAKRTAAPRASLTSPATDA